jgi:hypothetical protein
MGPATWPRCASTRAISQSGSGKMFATAGISLPT